MIVVFMIGRALTLAMFTAAAGCAGQRVPGVPAVRTDTSASLKGATVELRVTGGIAALSSDYVVRHDDRSFHYAQRHICARSCGAPLDSTAGKLAPNVADSLFTLIASQAPSLVRNDYGRTPDAADMFTYRLSVTLEGRTKIIRADDGTMPDAMRRIVDALTEVVAAAKH